MKTLVFAGSTRQQSFNRRLAAVAAQAARDLGADVIEVPADAMGASAVEAYLALRRIGATRSLNMLWAMAGALDPWPEGCDWRDVAAGGQGAPLVPAFHQHGPRTPAQQLLGAVQRLRFGGDGLPAQQAEFVQVWGDQAHPGQQRFHHLARPVPAGVYAQHPHHPPVDADGRGEIGIGGHEGHVVQRGLQRGLELQGGSVFDLADVVLTALLELGIEMDVGAALVETVIQIDATIIATV